MLAKIDPARFTNKPFMRRPSFAKSEGDQCIIIDGHAIGRIMQTREAREAVRWYWTITGPYLTRELRPSNGIADSLEGALEAFKAKFWAWQEWAVNEPSSAVWHH